jgi:uroporphyrinogen decarboxylase
MANTPTPMTQRERFLATAGFQATGRSFLLEPWVWAATLPRWISEGLPLDAASSAVLRTAQEWKWSSTLQRWVSEGLPCGIGLSEIFRTDQERFAPVEMQGSFGPHLLPGLPRRILEETDEFQVIQDEEGNTLKMFRKDPSSSMPQWVEYPMKNRHDWETIVKPRLDAKIPGRCPQGADLQHYADQVRIRDYPLGFWCGSFYGWPRSFLGVEGISVMFYDDPDLLHEMCDHIAEFVVQTITPILTAVQFDFAFIWEDMAGKAGPLCSPATYREFCLEPLNRVTKLLNKHGVRHIIVDSDGNNDVLIPLWLEAGVTGLRPFEVAAGCDAVAIRRKYGRSLIIQGAIDKRALAKGKESIDREVLSKVPWLCMQGGYFPQVDHLVPPDVSLENYTYYSTLLRAVVEEPERYLYEARRRGFWKE